MNTQTSTNIGNKINELIQIGKVYSDEFIRNNKELAEANLNEPMDASDLEFAKALLSEKHADIDMPRDEYLRLMAWAETVVGKSSSRKDLSLYEK